MSFVLLESFRKSPVLVAGRMPIVSFDKEHPRQASGELKNKPGDAESFSVTGAFRIAAIDFREAANALMVSVATTNAEAKITADDWMPVYYLPWVTNATVRTTLRPRSQTTRAGAAKGLHQIAANNRFLVDQNNPHSAVLDPNNPDIFFTAAVNGCSVTVRGSREEPTVYHGNAIHTQDASGENSPLRMEMQNRPGADALMDLKRQQMETFLTNFEAADPKLDRLGGAHTAAPSKMVVQANYQMFVSGGIVAPRDAALGARVSTDIARDEGRKAKNVRLTSSNGTVFGIRSATGWTFYFQKLVKYELWKNTAGFFSKAKWEKVNGSTGYHLVEFGEFWPNGPGVLVP